MSLEAALGSQDVFVSDLSCNRTEFLRSNQVFKECWRGPQQSPIGWPRTKEGVILKAQLWQRVIRPRV